MPIPRTWLALLLPPAEMVDLMSAFDPPAFRIFIGVAEVLATVGLTLPDITRKHTDARPGRQLRPGGSYGTT